MSKKETHWYVETLTDNTNEQLTAELAREGLSCEAETIITVRDKEVRAYLVPFRFVTMLKRSTAHRGHFRVYVREGYDGAVRHWNLQNKRVRGAEYRRIKEELEHRKQ